ncbi:RadC family protein [Clostridiaceae bacterium NSJ-31]|uniref:RadC family protein n=1 Tax=Ligaoa zhengdingensis TaxID=2763658 RepID=A0A926I3F4_9FIRM|nr:DNA repair protein RadC [Ligaoa zhengdingensis]MBC8545463.1 RadC family protein [Ligaoa zhengdingensis]
MANVHDKHRMRLRERFRANGLDDFQQHQVLELLLFYAIPRKDTNEIAHMLLEEFGSLAGVMDAPIEELVKVKGIGDGAATLLKLIPGVCRFYFDDKNTLGTLLQSTEDIVKFLIPKFVGETEEKVMLLCLDNRNRVAGCPMICRGDVVSANFTPRRVVETAIKYRATNVVLSHNHPMNDALPSRADLDTTFELYETLQRVNIRLLDHIIVSGSDAISIRDSGGFARL